jgi:hypothetical protein
LLVEERDFEALATAMKNLVRSPFAFREMGALASESVAANFEQREQIRQLESHYDEAIALAGAEERVVTPEIKMMADRISERAGSKTEIVGRNGSMARNGTGQPGRLGGVTVAK